MKESRIEEDINRINCIFEFQEKMGCQYVLETEDERAIKHLLSEYQMILKENEKLNVKILSNAGIYQLGFRDGEKTYIQKVKDKEEELNKLLADIDYKDVEDKQEREFYKKEYYQVVAQIKVLKELL